LGEILGFTANELRETNIHNIVAHPPEEVDSTFERTLAEGRLFIGERTYRRKDGSLVDVEVSASMIHFSNKEVVCVLVRDVTERKKNEEALREMREAERNRIARDLHDGALQVLTYALTEVRQILSAPEDPETGRRLRQTVEALERMAPELRGAIYDLRVDEERNKPLAESLRILIELGRRMNPDLDVRLDVADGFPARPLGGRSAERLWILQEALTNVRRHSGAKNAAVNLAIEDGFVVAEVADDGRGLVPAEWSPAGMGIRRMRERARALDGDLKIEGKPGKGTTVRFEASFAKERGGPEEKIKVLLVEDHASFRQATASVFGRERGFEVIGQAGSLAEARERLEKRVPDVAVIDLILPDGHG
jgi:PAS domain S-box-containing protein